MFARVEFFFFTNSLCLRSNWKEKLGSEDRSSEWDFTDFSQLWGILIKINNCRVNKICIKKTIGMYSSGKMCRNSTRHKRSRRILVRYEKKIHSVRFISRKGNLNSPCCKKITRVKKICTKKRNIFTWHLTRSHESLNFTRKLYFPPPPPPG